MKTADEVDPVTSPAPTLEPASLSFTARIGQAQSYRARSASTKYGLTAPLLSESRTIEFIQTYPT